MITGTKDVVCDAAHARTVMQRVVKEGMLEVVDFETGHWIMLEDEERFNKVLGEWLDGSDGEEKARL